MLTALPVAPASLTCRSSFCCLRLLPSSSKTLRRERSIQGLPVRCQDRAQSPPSTSGFFKPFPSRLLGTWEREEREGYYLGGYYLLETKRLEPCFCHSGSLSSARIPAAARTSQSAWPQ